MNKQAYSIRGVVEPIKSGFWGESDANNDGNARIVRNGDILENGNIKKDAPLRKLSENEISKAALEVGDIVIAVSGNVGKVAIVTKAIDDEGLPYVASNFVKILRVQKNLILPEYLYYFLRSRYFIDFLKKYTRGATIQNLSSDIFNQNILYIPGISKQTEIVSFLNQTSGLLIAREKALGLLNSYIESVFLQIVGNLDSNEKGWSFSDFGSYISVLTDYHANGSYETLKSKVNLLDSPDYALMVRTTDLEKNNFIDNVKYVDRNAYEFLEKSKVFGNEIIINKIGSAGKVYLMPSLGRPVSLGMNAFLLRLHDTTNTDFIYYLLKSSYGEHIIKGKVKGAVTKTIRKDAIRSIRVPNVPIELQNEFSLIVRHVNQIKNSMLNQSIELDNQFQLYMQKSFKKE